MNDCTIGFRVVGSLQGGKRRPVDHAAAFLAYSQCDDRCEVHRESYLSHFQFGDEYADYLDAHGTNKGFRGTCFTSWLWWDVDNEDNLEKSRRDAAKLCLRFVERYHLDDDDLLVFFSGSKGFSIGLPTSLFSPSPSPTFNKQAKSFALTHAHAAGAVIDPSIYDQGRAFRAPNSRHQKTGLHKRKLSLSDLMAALSIDAIKSLATTPEVFDVPSPSLVSPVATEDWRAAEVDAEASEAVRVEPCDREKLNRLTMDFIRNGASEGSRHNTLFSAARNLAELNCPLRLALALLTESGLDCGLSPSDVRRQIECGLLKGGA